MVTDGGVYRPALFEQAQMFADWDPRTAPAAGPESLDLPPSDDFSLTPWHVSPDKENRVNLSAWAASQHQRVFGYIASIEELTNLAENTDTAFRFEVIVRIPFLAEGSKQRTPEFMSWIYVKILAYSSNALICCRTGIRLGTFVTGIVTANYNGKGRAQLDAWSPVTDFYEWRALSADTFPDGLSYDWTEWVVDWTCVLGGAAFAVHETHENRINGIRIVPPTLDPFLYIRQRRAALNSSDTPEPDRPRTVTILGSDDNYVRPRGRSSSRRPRGH